MAAIDEKRPVKRSVQGAVKALIQMSRKSTFKKIMQVETSLVLACEVLRSDIVVCTDKTKVYQALQVRVKRSSVLKLNRSKVQLSMREAVPKQAAQKGLKKKKA